jgi:hypothetical protein
LPCFYRAAGGTDKEKEGVTDFAKTQPKYCALGGLQTFAADARFLRLAMESCHSSMGQKYFDRPNVDFEPIFPEQLF